ncbi:uncharacterized protein [Dendrobates tinctorius]|uniref:uncharacterized protein n=1 Tax=Dendrobates tinctorius TaxID=92724 RepID=UPI003CCA4C1A
MSAAMASPVEQPLQRRPRSHSNSQPSQVHPVCNIIPAGAALPPVRDDVGCRRNNAAAERAVRTNPTVQRALLQQQGETCIASTTHYTPPTPPMSQSRSAHPTLLADITPSSLLNATQTAIAQSPLNIPLQLVPETTLRQTPSQHISSNLGSRNSMHRRSLSPSSGDSHHHSRCPSVCRCSRFSQKRSSNRSRHRSRSSRWRSPSTSEQSDAPESCRSRRSGASRRRRTRSPSQSARRRASSTPIGTSGQIVVGTSAQLSSTAYPPRADSSHQLPHAPASYPPRADSSHRLPHAPPSYPPRADSSHRPPHAPPSYPPRADSSHRLPHAPLSSTTGRQQSSAATCSTITSTTGRQQSSAATCSTIAHKPGRAITSTHFRFRF